MAGTPLVGYQGTITVSGVDIGWIKNWEATVSVDEVEIGPFINDNGDTYIITTKRSIKGTLDGNVPSGKDAGQTALISSIMNGGYYNITLTETNGYTITVPSGIVTSVKKGQDASESVTFSAEFRNNGAFTIL